MDSDRDVDLLSHFWALHAALLKRDGLEARMRTGAADEEMFDRSLAAAEGVLAARSGLYRYLISQGWTPPDTTVRDLVYDETVLSETDGAVHG
ncbi:MAG: hypothetical protein JWN88_1560 [Frankiales bacterium]|jgi:hypothetical protein|nr:hypothetical protein [Frankiales bacterium]